MNASSILIQHLDLGCVSQQLEANHFSLLISYPVMNWSQIVTHSCFIIHSCHDRFEGNNIIIFITIVLIFISFRRILCGIWSKIYEKIIKFWCTQLYYQHCFSKANGHNNFKIESVKILIKSRIKGHHLIHIYSISEEPEKTICESNPQITLLHVSYC